MYFSSTTADRKLLSTLYIILNIYLLKVNIGKERIYYSSAMLEGKSITTMTNTQISPFPIFD